MSNKIITHIFLLSLLVFSQACSTATESANKRLSLSCGDLFSIYANKPINLEYKTCKKHSRQQTLLEAEYYVSDENADEVEKLLVDNYKLRSACDYYHAMPMNQVSLQPKKLLAIDPYYHLFITIKHQDVEALAHSDCREKRNKAFVVIVSVVEV